MSDDATPASRRRSRRRSRNNLPTLKPVFPLALRSKQTRPVCLWHRSGYDAAVHARVLAGRAAMARLTVLLVGVVQNARYTLHRTIAHMRSSASQFADYRLVVVENDSTDGTAEELRKLCQADDSLLCLIGIYHVAPAHSFATNETCGDGGAPSGGGGGCSGARFALMALLRNQAPNSGRPRGWLLAYIHL